MSAPDRPEDRPDDQPSAASHQPKRSRRRLWLWGALALSVTLNVAVLGGFLYWRGKADGVRFADRQRLSESVRDLGLTQTEMEGLMAFRRQMGETARAAGRASRPFLNQLSEELQSPNPDLARIAELQERVVVIRSDQQRAVSAAFSIFVLSVAPERRAGVIAALRHRLAQVGPPGDGGAREPGSRDFGVRPRPGEGPNR